MSKFVLYFAVVITLMDCVMGIDSYEIPEKGGSDLDKCRKSEYDIDTDACRSVRFKLITAKQGPFEGSDKLLERCREDGYDLHVASCKILAWQQSYDELGSIPPGFTDEEACAASGYKWYMEACRRDQEEKFDAGQGQLPSEIAFERAIAYQAQIPERTSEVEKCIAIHYAKGEVCQNLYWQFINDGHRDPHGRLYLENCRKSGYNSSDKGCKDFKERNEWFRNGQNPKNITDLEDCVKSNYDDHNKACQRLREKTAQNPNISQVLYDPFKDKTDYPTIVEDCFKKVKDRAKWHNKTENASDVRECIAKTLEKLRAYKPKSDFEKCRDSGYGLSNKGCENLVLKHSRSLQDPMGETDVRKCKESGYDTNSDYCYEFLMRLFSATEPYLNRTDVQ